MPLRLFGVLRDPVYHQTGIPYDFDHQPDVENRTKIISTGLHRGYVATFCLRRNGQLILQSYSYPIDFREYDIEIVNETLNGEFWIVLQRHFHDKWCRLIPFQAGHVVTDRSKWEDRSWDWSNMTAERLESEVRAAYKPTAKN